MPTSRCLSKIGLICLSFWIQTETNKKSENSDKFRQIQTKIQTNSDQIRPKFRQTQKIRQIHKFRPDFGLNWNLSEFGLNLSEFFWIFLNLSEFWSEFVWFCLDLSDFVWICLNFSKFLKLFFPNLSLSELVCMSRSELWFDIFVCHFGLTFWQTSLDLSLSMLFSLSLCPSFSLSLSLSLFSLSLSLSLSLFLSLSLSSLFFSLLLSSSLLSFLLLSQFALSVSVPLHPSYLYLISPQSIYIHIYMTLIIST